jgi:hypothetical protein
MGCSRLIEAYSYQIMIIDHALDLYHRLAKVVQMTDLDINRAKILEGARDEVYEMLQDEMNCEEVNNET